MKIEELNVYLLIIRRLLSIFLDPKIVSETDAVTQVGSSFFHSKGTSVQSEGYSVLYKDLIKKKDEKVLPKLKKGQKFPIIDVITIKKKTSPPKRFDDPDLLTAMANAGSHIEEDELKNVLKDVAGLGTSATRGAIVEKLIQYEMIGRKGKSLYATEKGMKIIEVIGERDISSPRLTAVWEKKLQGVEDGSYSIAEFKRDMEKYIKNSVSEQLANIKPTYLSNSTKEREVIGVCPKCKRNVVATKNYYLCESYKEECDFIIGTTYAKSKITKTDVRALLKGKETREKKLTFKSGKTSTVALKLNEEFRISPSFTSDSAIHNSTTKTLNKENIFGKCPSCNGDIYVNDYAMSCSDKEVCGFSVSRKILGVTLTDEDFLKLLARKQTEEKEFEWSNGKKGKASLEYKKKKLQFNFTKQKSRE